MLQDRNWAHVIYTPHLGLGLGIAVSGRGRKQDRYKEEVSREHSREQRSVAQGSLNWQKQQQGKAGSSLPFSTPRGNILLVGLQVARMKKGCGIRRSMTRRRLYKDFSFRWIRRSEPSPYLRQPVGMQLLFILVDLRLFLVTSIIYHIGNIDQLITWPSLLISNQFHPHPLCRPPAPYNFVSHINISLCTELRPVK